LKKNIYSKVKKFLKRKINTRKYHLRHRDEAKEILTNLESVNGKTNPQLIKLSDEYARDVLGDRVYAPWLYVYSALAGDFKEGWIPDNYYGKVVIPAIKGNYRALGLFKALSNQLFQSSAFPDVAYYVNGLFLERNYTVLDERKVKEVLFKNGEVVVYKLEHSARGEGIFFFDKDSFDTKKIQRLGNGVFQDYIDQHPFFKEYMPSSVATLRLTTIIDDSGNPSVRACFLRTARSGDTHVNSSSGILTSVNLKTGELDALGYLRNWRTVDRHPDTDIAFAGRRIPNFDNCVSVALELHRLIPYVRCVGWDMVVNKDNDIKVMEWNGGHNGIMFSEATQGPCFSDLGWEKLWQR